MRVASVARGADICYWGGCADMSRLNDSLLRRSITRVLRLASSRSAIPVGLLGSVLLLAWLLYQPESSPHGASRNAKPIHRLVPLPQNGAASDSLSNKVVASSIGPTTSLADSATATNPQSTPAQATAVVTFTDSGVQLEGGGALAWGDYDSDGDLDLVLVGRDGQHDRTAIYRNDGGAFTRTDVVLPALWNAAADWGDFDSDGDLDLALAGMTASGPITRVYQNQGGTFADIEAKVAAAGFSAVAWGHIDPDGQLDLAVSGSSLTHIYANSKGGLADIKAGLGGAQFGSLAWGDCDGDGDFDLAVGGEYNTGWSFEPVSVVYQNQGGRRFAPMNTNLPVLSNACLAWADYDNDGDLDLGISGFGATGAITRVYRNNGSGAFTDANARLTGLGAGSLAWGDMDNDGDADLVVTGCYHNENTGQQCAAKLYRNDGNSVFTPVEAPFVGVHYSCVAWGDYDRDGDLDLAISGVTCDYELITRIYRNNCPVPNTPPQPPGNLSAQTVGDTITFNWTAGFDAETPATGLYYNIRVGTQPGMDDVYSAMSDSATGFRRKPGVSGLQQRLSWTVEGLKNPPYFWSVQSVDAGYAGSAWAGEPSENWSRVENTTKATWHETIQDAINGSEDGDELVLTPGVYTGSGNWELDFSSGLPAGSTRNITLRGKNSSSATIIAQTVIDCAALPSRVPRRAFRFDSGETADAVLEGFTIRNASAPASGDVSADGGAIYISDSGPTIRRCVFENCGSPGRGGAVAATASGFWRPTVSLTECTFTGNRANVGGGAVYASGSYLEVKNCSFKGNSAPAGGALLHESGDQSYLWIRNTVFDANFATQAGGAICTGLHLTLDITNSTFTNNVAQQAGGLYSATDSSCFVSNCIFWDNRDSSGTGENAQLQVGPLQLRYSRVQGIAGVRGTASTGEDPRLEDIDGPDDDPVTWMDNRLGLSRFSSCINSGDPGIVYVDQVDIDGEERVQSCRPDIGADETGWSLPRADYNRDCRVDIADLRYFMMCSTAPGVRQTDPSCVGVDLDGDEFGDVDAIDFAIFQRCWSGSDKDADPGCDGGA